MVTTAQSQNSGKLVGKDFIFIAIFGVLLFIVFFAFAAILGMNANTFWFTHALGAIPGGIVWIYLAQRVPKRGAFAIMGAIIAIVSLLLGMLWTGPVGIIIGGIIADFIMNLGAKRSATKNIVAFVVFTLCFWIGQAAMIFLAGQSYVETVVAMGMSAEYGQTLVDFIHGPIALVSIIATTAGSFFGGFIGTKVFKKHFAKISA